MSTNAAPAIHCSQCGQAREASDVATIGGVTVCAACKQEYLRRLQEGSSAAVTLHYKGFWIRFLAILIDSAVLSLVCLPIWIWLLFPLFRAANFGAPLPPALLATLVWTILLYELGAVAITVVYRGWMYGRFGATLGKMAIGARVISADGTRLTMAHGFGRALAQVITDLTSFLLAFGYLMAAFDDKKRALHDRIAGTLVVAK